MNNINALVRISYEMYLLVKASSLPANPYVLAERLGIRVKEADESCVYHEVIGKDMSLLVFEGGGPCIYLKSRNGDTFAPILHEISHVQLKHISDNPDEEADANLLTMIHRVPPVFLRKYKGDKLDFVMFLSGCNRLEARKYLLKLKEAGYRNLRTSLDEQMCLQFDGFIREYIKPSIRKITMRIAALFLAIVICASTGVAASSVFHARQANLHQGNLNTDILPELITPSEQAAEIKTVHIYPTGSRYHNNPVCQGSGSVDIPLEKALALKKLPCSHCVFD